jgi:hypothetical protein
VFVCVVNEWNMNKCMIFAGNVAKLYMFIGPAMYIPQFFFIRWGGYNDINFDHRKFLGYMLHYRKVAHDNAITDLYVDRDECPTWYLDLLI